MKKVSILIPCYNSEKWLAETLDCCLRQSYTNIEVILVDDGSTDNSLSIAREYEQKDSRIHVFTQPNSGGCKARNLAFEKSTGDYIMYLDADDLMSDNKIEVQMKRLEEEGDAYSVAVCPWETFSNGILPSTFNDRFFYKDYSSGLDLIEDAWYNGDWYVITCYLSPRQLIKEAGPWDERLTKIQDSEFFCRVISKATKILYCSDAKFYYRRGYVSVSSSNRYSEDKLRSALLGRILYKQVVLPLRDTRKIRHGLARCFSEVMLNSPYGSKWYIEAKRQIEELGEIPFHPSPSKKVAILEKLIGFERLMYIKTKLMQWGIKR